jgi:hypothetical protein
MGPDKFRPVPDMRVQFKGKTIEDVEKAVLEAQSQMTTSSAIRIENNRYPTYR